MRYLKVFRTNRKVNYVTKLVLLASVYALFMSLIMQAAVICSGKNSEETLYITPSINQSMNTTDNSPEGFITNKKTLSVFTTVYAEENESLNEDLIGPVKCDEFHSSLTSDNELLVRLTQRVIEERERKEAEEARIKTEEEAARQAELLAAQEEEMRRNGTVKEVPAGRGSNHTFMGWQCITCKSSPQYRLRIESGENYDENGFAKVGDRYVVATKPYYGTIGDYIDVFKSNGEIIKCIIGDQKGSDGGGDMYGHADGSIVEFVVDRNTWYSGYNGLGRYLSIATYHPTWVSSNIDKIINVGNYWN